MTVRIIALAPATEKALFKARETEDREALAVAGRIVEDVRSRGDKALQSWTQKLDRVDLVKSGSWVSPSEFAAAQKKVSREFLRAIKHAANNIRHVAEKQSPCDWKLRVEPGVTIQQLVRPLESIGCYIPGGRFALVSTLLMTVIPAQVAGVREIIAVCPHPNNELLAAARFLGITRLARIGGAQAIAAMAFGTNTIPRVEKIFGPGNRFVTAAKQIVSANCAIDLPAGPTEAIVLAERGNPKWIAADLLAQAEHAPDAGSFLVTTSRKLATQVAAEVQRQLNTFSPDNPAHASFQCTSAILIADSLPDAITFVNRFAPEHLSLPENSVAVLNQIHSAGTIFLGPLSAQPFGDYATGSNHVLPTGGWARRRGGLSTNDFVKRISVQTIDPAGYKRLADDVHVLAIAEGLEAHANGVEVRR
jgi:histidinol dehydrogenase